MTNGSATAATLTVGANSTTSAFYGRIQNGTTTGANAVNLTKTGLGTFTLLNNNSYTGTTTVSQGTLAVGRHGRCRRWPPGWAHQLDATQFAMLRTAGCARDGWPASPWRMWNVAPANAHEFRPGHGPANNRTYQTNAINGKPAVRFDGEPNDQLLFSAAPTRRMCSS